MLIALSDRFITFQNVTEQKLDYILNVVVNSATTKKLEQPALVADDSPHFKACETEEELQALENELEIDASQFDAWVSHIDV